MRKIFLHIALLIITIISVKAQNLVPNPDFEDYDELHCKRPGINQPQLFGIKHWIWPTLTSPDIYSTLNEEKCETYACTPGSIKSSAGHQLPRSGMVMVGIYTWGKFNHNEYHEYLQAKLTEPLVPGNKYYVEFWVTRSCLVDVASNNIGAYFSEKQIIRKNIIPLCFVPQVNETKIIGDSVNWTKICGEFIADKAYNYILLGNFFKDSQSQNRKAGTCNTQYILSNNEAYYYIDDVLIELVRGENINYFDSDSNNAAKLTWNDSPIEKNMVVVMSSIFFDFGTAKLDSLSYPELRKLLDLMKNNPTIVVEISGHTDSIGEEEYNTHLSIRRAQSVADYLIANGIDNKRLMVIGYGNTKPISADDKQNRRVEFKIIDL